MGLPGLQFAMRVLRSNYQRLAFPYKLTFAVTYRCNARCLACGVWRKHAAGELATGEIETFFARSNRFSWIDLTGGEPSLRDDFVAICAAAVRHNRGLFLLHFPTNGWLTDKIVADVRAVRALSDRFRMVITVSLDGDEPLHDRVRGVAGAWRHAVETFARLREIAGAETVLGVTLTPFNSDGFAAALAGVRRVCPDVRAGEFHLSLMNYSDIYYGNTGLRSLIADAASRTRTAEDMARSIDLYCRLTGFPLHPRGILERAFLRHARSFLRTGRAPLPCHALKSSCFIDPAGEVYPCITFDRPLGNLRDSAYDLSPLWRSDRAAALQREVWQLACPQCWTGCDGYQTVLGNWLRMRSTRRIRA